MNKQFNDNKNMSKQAVDPKKAQIHNLIIVDESGSMGGLEQATIGGINETIATIRKAQEDFADTQQHYLTLLTFDTGDYGVPPIRLHMAAMPIAQVTDFTNYHPRGGTPLFDATPSSPMAWRMLPASGRVRRCVISSSSSRKRVGPSPIWARATMWSR